MEYDPKNRYNCEEALNDPWLKKINSKKNL